MSTAPMAERAEKFRERFQTIRSEIGKVIVGQPEIVEGVLSLYGGDSPHIVKQKLMSFFSNHGKEAKAA